MASPVRSLIRKGRALLGRGGPACDQQYWDERAGRYGARSVLHIGHSDEEALRVTGAQRDLLFPLLAGELHGDEAVLLDYGCGPGRFTPGLAALIDGRAVGVDPTARLLDLAPAGGAVEYRLMSAGRVPLPDASVDVVWTVLVLGAITRDEDRARAATEIRRVLKPGGLLFLVENTTGKVDLPHWVYRTVEDYQRLFAGLPLRHLHDYFDLGETISVMAGRAPAV